MLTSATHAPFGYAAMSQGRDASSLKPQKHTPLDCAAMHNRDDTCWLKPQRTRMCGGDVMGAHRGFGMFGEESAALAFLDENRPESNNYFAEKIVRLPSTEKPEPGAPIWTIRANKCMEVPDCHTEQRGEPESDEESYEADSASEANTSSSASSTYTNETEYSRM